MLSLAFPRCPLAPPTIIEPFVATPGREPCPVDDAIALLASLNIDAVNLFPLVIEAISNEIVGLPTLALAALIKDKNPFHSDAVKANC